MHQVTVEKALMYEPMRMDKRNCGIFLVFMFLLAFTFVAGTLLGYYRFGNQTEYIKVIPTSLSSSVIVRTTPTPIVYVPKTFEVKFELDAIKFAPSLADQASDDFKSLTAILEEKLRAPISYKYNEHFTLKLIKFESSSSNATDATVRIRWPEYENEDTMSPTIKDITAQLEQYINVREGHIGGHHIRSNSLNVENLIDECHDKKRTSCSHICDFQTTTLMFKCSCPDNLILRDKTQCVDRSSVKPTEREKPVNIASILERAQRNGGVVTVLRYENKKNTTTTTTQSPEGVTSGSQYTNKPTEKTKPVNIASILERGQNNGGVSDIQYKNKKTVPINETLINGSKSTIIQSIDADHHTSMLTGTPHSGK